ncbi:MAG: AzlD domain-containing protein [Pseudomonadota bacterium]
MTGWSDVAIWGIIVALGIGTWLVRFSFLGLIGDRALPPWLLRHLRYTPVAVIPALLAPLIVWPPATGGQTEPARLIAAIVCIVVGLWTRSLVGSIVAGMGTLYAVQGLL